LPAFALLFFRVCSDAFYRFSNAWPSPGDDDKPFDIKMLPNAYLTSPQESHTFVYVSTIQRMTINLFGWESAFPQDSSDPDYEEDTEKLDIPIHAFDAIIADECHRGYTKKETAIWRSVLEYFDAIKIGLTATPASHSLSLFREVIYRYTTEQAILDGYLVDYDPIKIKSNVRMKGIFLKEGDPVGIIDTATGEEIYDELEDEREFSTEDIEQKITAPESNRKIIKEIGFCHTLRHDGIDYGDYIEQLTYLLFLKMADEKGIKIPKWGLSQMTKYAFQSMLNISSVLKS
jgi:type I site-specific restriction endonuclease